MKKIIINADDFGLSRSVNLAIINCFQKGNLTSATMMANMPGADDAADRASKNPGLGIGLHFCLTEGSPLTRCRTLVDESGKFHPRSVFLRKSLQRTLDLSELVCELQAQFDRLNALGIKPTHIDSHQHVHMIPSVFEAIRGKLKEFKLPVRLVRPLFSRSLFLARPISGIKRALLYCLGAKHWGLEIPANNRLVSIYDLALNRELGSWAYELLISTAREREVTEIMVHPYILGEDVVDLYRDQLEMRLPFLRRCECEYRVLSNSRIFTSGSEYRLINYSNLNHP